MEGLEKPALVVNPSEAVAAGVTHPPLVHVGVEARLEPGHSPALVMVVAVLVGAPLAVAAAGAAVADALGRVEIPHAHLEAEVPIGEGAHRADVDHVARVLV